MGALLILFVAGLYLWLVIAITRRVKPGWGKLIVLVIAVLIPTADAIVGRIYLKHLCTTEGGLKIYRTVEGVEGFYEPTSSPEEEWIRKYGYKFVEGEDLSGKPARMSLQPDGTIVFEKNVVLQSKYAFEPKIGNPKDLYYRGEENIRVMATNEILSRYVNFSYAGGWVERAIAGLYAARGKGGTCETENPLYELVTKTLKPIK